LARRVYTIERHKPLLAEAERRFATLRLSNIVAKSGDGSRGWPEQAPFDRIMITAAAPEMPYALIGQLKEGGILVAPIGPERGDQDLYRVTRTAGGETRERMCAVRFVPLIAGAAEESTAAPEANRPSATASRTRT
jgi:protein-L-isoaspartate(D-aspartate) O-methyltransferase